MIAPAELVAEWERAYQQYSQASDWVTNQPDSPQAAHATATTSAEVARLWLDLSRLPGLGWWAVAALQTAARTYETQSRDWHDRATPPAAAAIAQLPPRWRS